MEFWIGVLCTAIGMAIYHFLRNKFFIDGTIKIDSTNPEKDVYRLEINDLDSLKKKKRIVLRVDHHADLSQK